MSIVLETTDLLLQLLRKDIRKNSTGGELSAWVTNRWVLLCYVVEDEIRELGLKGTGKVYGETAIPAGRYQIRLTESKRFGKLLPELINVPFFSGIRIHTGNTEKDTDGCLIVGLKYDNKTGQIRGGTSGPAMKLVMDLFQQAINDHRRIIIDIVNPT